MASVMSLEDDERAKVTVVLFTEVTNSKKIREKLKGGKLDATFVTPKLITDLFQVLVAANKAVHNLRNQKMKTRSIYSEILYSLSPSKNITESLKNFSISDSDTEVIAIILGDENGEKLKMIADEVEGKQAPLDIIQKLKDVKLIRKVYGIKDDEFNSGDILNSIVSRIAIKDYT